MKFKNYKNPHTNDNRIYSHSDIYNMPLGEVFKRKDELLAQYRVLGAPKESELKNSENVVYVEAYTRSDGTEVKAHWRSKPGGGSSAGQTSDVKNESDKAQENTQENKETTSQKEENEKLYPKEIAGVKRGEPMSFEEAGGENVNPDYYEGKEYQTNCQSCVVAYEARRRGYDVTAAGNTEGSRSEELGENPCNAWIDPETGEPCQGVDIDLSKENCGDYLEKNVQEGERYIMIYGYDRTLDNKTEATGHVRIIERNDNNELRIYDPQSGSVVEGEYVKDFFDTWAGETADYNPTVLRIDDKEFNQYYINDVVRPR